MNQKSIASGMLAGFKNGVSLARQRAELDQRNREMQNLNNLELQRLQQQKEISDNELKLKDRELKNNYYLESKKLQQQKEIESRQRRQMFGIGAYSNADSVLGRQRTVLDEYKQIAQQAQLQRAQKVQMGREATGALMKMCQMNGGFASPEVLMKYNRDMGMNNDRAFVGAGFTQAGDFFIDFGYRDQNGNLQRKTETMSPEQQAGVIGTLSGVFDDTDRASIKKTLINRGYSEKEASMLMRENQTLNGRATQQKNLLAQSLGKQSTTGKAFNLKEYNDYLNAGKENGALTDDEYKALYANGLQQFQLSNGIQPKKENGIVTTSNTGMTQEQARDNTIEQPIQSQNNNGKAETYRERNGQIYYETIGENGGVASVRINNPTTYQKKVSAENSLNDWKEKYSPKLKEGEYTQYTDGTYWQKQKDGSLKQINIDRQEQPSENALSQDDDNTPETSEYKIPTGRYEIMSKISNEEAIDSGLGIINPRLRGELKNHPWRFDITLQKHQYPDRKYFTTNTYPRSVNEKYTKMLNNTDDRGVLSSLATYHRDRIMNILKSNPSEFHQNAFDLVGLDREESIKEKNREERSKRRLKKGIGRKEDALKDDLRELLKEVNDEEYKEEEEKDEHVHPELYEYDTFDFDSKLPSLTEPV